TALIAIRDPIDGEAPELSLDVADGGLLQNGVIGGSVADATLDSWRLLLISRASGDVFTLAEGVAARDGALGEFDAGRYLSGFFTLRLEATDLAGLRSIVERAVEVAPREPVGLRTSASDATVIIGGVGFD